MTRAARRAEIAGWLVVALLAVAALQHLVAPEVTRWAILATALTPLLYMPAWPVAALAGVTRRWRLATAALCLVGLHAWWTLPVVAGGADSLAGPHLTVRVLALNLDGNRTTGADTTRLIAREHPDVVVLSEASPLSVGGLRLDGFPTRLQDIRPNTNGWLVASRWPLVASTTVGIGDRTVPRLVLRRPDGGDLVVWQVHPIAPVPGFVDRWRTQLTRIRAAVSGDLRPGTAAGTGPQPAIVAGDFNATRDIPGLSRMLDDGWVDALAGRGLLPTWPVGRRFLPPVLPLDHVLLSPGLGVGRVRRADVGSDHLAVLVDVQLPR